MKNSNADKAKADLENALEQNLISEQCDSNFLAAWISRTEIYIKQGISMRPPSASQRMVAIDARSQATYQAEGMLAEYYLANKRFDKASVLLSRC